MKRISSSHAFLGLLILKPIIRKWLLKDIWVFSCKSCYEFLRLDPSVAPNKVDLI